jgi:hypothetical protein
MPISFPTIQWVLEAISPEKLVADHPPPFSAEVKKEWSYTYTCPMCFYGAYSDNCTITRVQMQNTFVECYAYCSLFTLAMVAAIIIPKISVA